MATKLQRPRLFCTISAATATKGRQWFAAFAASAGDGSGAVRDGQIGSNEAHSLDHSSLLPGACLNQLREKASVTGRPWRYWPSIPP
ncbi:MAG: hypothetical protein DMG30_07230 [Acidobacteria bacterium]|nr:MAG: hypothetical protein DMG30_07230 [Acidobacteriota bacterium]